ncbi:ribonuclease [Lachnospiraceae bacterium NK3A20]|nr:ribonuclease [Lachnospiraceae bacterium NK3A20]
MKIIRKWLAPMLALMLSAQLLTGCASAMAPESGTAQTEATAAATSAEQESTLDDTASSAVTAAEEDSDSQEKTDSNDAAVDTENSKSEVAPTITPIRRRSNQNRTSSAQSKGNSVSKKGVTVEEDGEYFTKDEVALYIYTYGRLPENFITKKQARKLGWEGGALEPYAPGKAIGGDYYGNYEGVLPDGPDYHECDIDTKGRKRGAKRIVYSDDGKIYYTDDHYESFTLLYKGGANQKEQKRSGGKRS